MARFIGIDYGTVRIGVAVTDPLGLIAYPLKTVKANEILPFLQTYTAKERIEGIVIGMPFDLERRQTNMTNLVKRFTRLLHRIFPEIPLYHHDERFTSLLAQASILESGMKKKKRRDKKHLDAISASFILRSFLTLHKSGKSEPLSHITSSIPLNECI